MRLSNMDTSVWLQVAEVSLSAVLNACMSNENRVSRAEMGPFDQYSGISSLRAAY
jgi:hypothetical protein